MSKYRKSTPEFDATMYVVLRREQAGKDTHARRKSAGLMAIYVKIYKKFVRVGLFNKKQVQDWFSYNGGSSHADYNDVMGLFSGTDRTHDYKKNKFEGGTWLLNNVRKFVTSGQFKGAEWRTHTLTMAKV